MSKSSETAGQEGKAGQESDREELLDQYHKAAKQACITPDDIELNEGEAYWSIRRYIDGEDFKNGRLTIFLHGFNAYLLGYQSKIKRQTCQSMAENMRQEGIIEMRSVHEKIQAYNARNPQDQIPLTGLVSASGMTATMNAEQTQA